MSAFSRNKGKRHERAVANAFKAVVPDARRGLSQTRGGGAEEPDIVIPRLHIEAKHHRKVSIWAAMAQAVADCPANKLPACIVKENRRPDLAVMRLDDFIEMFGRLLSEEWARAQAALNAAPGPYKIPVGDGGAVTVHPAAPEPTAPGLGAHMHQWVPHPNGTVCARCGAKRDG